MKLSALKSGAKKEKLTLSIIIIHKTRRMSRVIREVFKKYCGGLCEAICGVGESCFGRTKIPRFCADFPKRDGDGGRGATGRDGDGLRKRPDLCGGNVLKIHNSCRRFRWDIRKNGNFLRTFG